MSALKWFKSYENIYPPPLCDWHSIWNLIGEKLRSRRRQRRGFERPSQPTFSNTTVYAHCQSPWVQTGFSPFLDHQRWHTPPKPMLSTCTHCESIQGPLGHMCDLLNPWANPPWTSMYCLNSRSQGLLASESGDGVAEVEGTSVSLSVKSSASNHASFLLPFLTAAGGAPAIPYNSR